MLVDIRDIKDKPHRYLDKTIKIIGMLYYAGKKELKRGGSINLPEIEHVNVGILQQGDFEITCYGQRDLDLRALNDKKVEIIGELMYISGEYILKIKSVKEVPSD